MKICPIGWKPDNCVVINEIRQKVGPLDNAAKIASLHIYVYQAKKINDYLLHVMQQPNENVNLNRGLDT